MRALLPPRTPLPVRVGVQIFLDGRRYGGRFPSAVNRFNEVNRGVAWCTELEGCVVVGYRVAAPGALDLLVESGGGGEEGAGAMQE